MQVRYTLTARASGLPFFAIASLLLLRDGREPRLDAAWQSSTFHVRRSNVIDVPRAVERVPDLSLRNPPRTV